MTTDVMTKQELVKQARSLERMLARRRKIVAALTALDDQVRHARHLIRDLTAPDPAEVYRPSNDGEPMGGPA